MVLETVHLSHLVFVKGEKQMKKFILLLCLSTLLQHCSLHADTGKASQFYEAMLKKHNKKKIKFEEFVNKVIKKLKKIRKQ